jgi:lysophospholipase L1-like esterase
MDPVTRRAFLRATAVTTMSAFCQSGSNAKGHFCDSNFKFLFQGDSITDGNRGRSADPNHILGHGYVFSIASTLGSKLPGRNLSFINKGVSGDRVSDLINRWDNDSIAETPDVITILVGINDLLASMDQNAVEDIRHFEDSYRRLIAGTLERLPKTLIVLAEPFILPVGMVINNIDRWKSNIAAAQKTVMKLSREYNTIHIPFQKMFDDACSIAPAEYWIWDGIHPTYSGHGLMASLWIKTVSVKCPQIA